MKPAVAFSLAVVTGLFAGGAVAQTRTGPCVRVEVSSGSPAAPVLTSAVVPRSPGFSATRVLDLTFTVLFQPTFAGEHVVELRVFTPDAQLYRSIAVPVAPNAVANATREVEGYPRPLPLQALKQVSRGRGRFAAASTALPVGGTDIVSSGLYGRWRVEAYLDGAAQRCGPAAAFALNP